MLNGQLTNPLDADVMEIPDVQTFLPAHAAGSTLKELSTSLAASQRLANVLGIGGLCLSAFALGVLG